MKNNLIRKIYQDKTINKITKKVKLLGVDCKYDVIDLLNKRVVRLTEEINIDAPKIIIKNELKLIKDLIEKMLIQLEEK